jgi:DNA-binding XRE family transcriptional regulator
MFYIRHNSVLMKKENLIKWEDFEKELFSPKELEELEVKAQQRIALRQLRELRKEYNISQKALSIKSGIPRSTISKIETGQRNVSMAKLVQIANALDRDLEIRFVERRKKRKI